MECDASGSGLGAVLHQGTGLVAFFSKLTASRHARLAAYECELIGLVQAVRHWRPYLWGRRFLLDQRLSTVAKHQWACKLLGFDFGVQYKSGVANFVADTLSRRDEHLAEAFALSAPQFSLFDELSHEVASTPTQFAIREDIAKGAKPPAWAFTDGLITFKGCVLVPLSSASLPTILEPAHGLGPEGTQNDGISLMVFGLCGPSLAFRLFFSFYDNILSVLFLASFSFTFSILVQHLC